MAHSARGVGVALCVVSGVAYGTVGIFGKLALDEGLSVPAMLAPRFAIAAAVLWAITLALGPRLRPTAAQVRTGLALGLLVYAAQSGLYFLALSRLDAAFTILLVQVAPVLVAVGAYVFGRERIGRVLLISLPIAVVGTALIATGARVGAADGLGIVFALFCAVAYAAYMLLSHAAVERMHPIPLSASVCTGSAIAFTGWAVMSGNLPRTGGRGWVLILALAIIGTVIAITALAAGNGRVGPSTAVLLQTVEPLTATMLALVVLGERLEPVQWVGAALVVIAVVYLSMDRGLDDESG